jgi:alpha-galactosidase
MRTPKGLKCGLHLLRGIPRQAVTQNTPVLNSSARAASIADTKAISFWNTDMYGVDMTKPGAQEYLNSVYQQYADWGEDFVKVDDLTSAISPVLPWHGAKLFRVLETKDH